VRRWKVQSWHDDRLRAKRSVYIVHPFRMSVVQLLVQLKDVVNVANEALRPHFIDDIVLAHMPVYL